MIRDPYVRWCGRLGQEIAPAYPMLGMICVGISGAIIGAIIDHVEKKLLAGIRS